MTVVTTTDPFAGNHQALFVQMDNRRIPAIHIFSRVPSPKQLARAEKAAQGR
jgi:hypothetical protein